MIRTPRLRETARAALALMLVGTLAGGCALAPRDPTGGAKSRAVPDERQVERWRALGKIAVRSEEERWTATLDWRQARERYRIRLGGPLGQGAVQIEGGPRGVELTAATGEKTKARTAETLLARELGWTVPASSLRHWITGRARPGAPVRELRVDEFGRIERLEQQGWRIDYQRHEPVGPYELPTRLSLHGGGVTMRVVVRDWSLDTRI